MMDTIATDTHWLPPCSSNGTSGVFDGEDADLFVRYLLLVYPVLFLLVGVPADLLSMVIWSRRIKDSQGSTALYLTVLCAVDTLVLILGCLRHLLMTAVCLDLRPLFGCKVPMFLYTWLSTVSVWTICLMCFERLVCVIWPFDMKVICRTRNGLASLATVATLCACANLYLLIIVHVSGGGDSGGGQFCDAQPQFVHLRPTFNTLDSVVYSYLPFALIVSLNAVIVLRLSKRRRNLGRGSGVGGGSGGGGVGGGRGRGSNKIFFTVFCMALCHLLFTAPIVVWHIGASDWCNFDKRPVACARLEFVWQILEKLNHLTHFFIFSFTAPVFTSDLRALVGSVCPRLASGLVGAGPGTAVVDGRSRASSRRRQPGSGQSLQQLQQKHRQSAGAICDECDLQLLPLTQQQQQQHQQIGSATTTSAGNIGGGCDTSTTVIVTCPPAAAVADAAMVVENRFV